MSNASRTKTIFDNIANRDVPVGVVSSFVDAIIEDRNLNPNGLELTNEERAGLFIQWVREILRRYKSTAVAKAKYQEAEDLRASTYIDTGGEI